MHSLLKKWKKKKNQRIFNQNLNFKMVVNFIYVYNIIHHHKKNQSKIPSTILILKYICKISNFVMNIILSQMYTIS
jgi:hypothetical protein